MSSMLLRDLGDMHFDFGMIHIIVNGFTHGSDKRDAWPMRHKNQDVIAYRSSFSQGKPLSSRLAVGDIANKRGVPQDVSSEASPLSSSSMASAPADIANNIA